MIDFVLFTCAVVFLIVVVPWLIDTWDTARQEEEKTDWDQWTHGRW